MKIGDIETKRDIFLVLEAGVNHENSMNTAVKMIEEAAKAGADAIKFQSFKAEKLASVYSPGFWDFNMEPIRTQYEFFKKYDKFNEKEYLALADCAKENGIIFMSTPFDEESADYLERLMPIYKIASSDITNIPFIRYIARKGKPVFLSTGASNINEISHAVNVLKEEGVVDITLLHCILNYPTLYENANLNMISDLKMRFPEYRIGYSDHTIADKAMIVLVTAAIIGAQVIEKHYTLDKSVKGNDHLHALDPSDIRVFLENIEIAKKAIGKREKTPLKSEDDAIIFARRSIVANITIQKGMIIKEDMITFKRPGTGISPADLENVLGKKAKVDIGIDKILSWEEIE